MPIALVTGANRGLGLEAARQLVRRGYQVIASARELPAAEAAAAELGPGARPLLLDVTDADAVAPLARLVAPTLRVGQRVNAVCPGWVRTRMGGPAAGRSVERGAQGIVWAAVLGADGPNGGFFRDGRPIDW